MATQEVQSVTQLLLPMLALALTLCLVLVMVLLHWHSRLPGPPRLPILGSYLFMPLPYRPWLAAAAKRYGPVFGFKLAGHTWVSLNSYEAIHEAFVINADCMSGRQKSLWSETVFRGSGVVLGDGQVWQKHRKLSLKLLREFGMRRSCTEETVIAELQHALSEAQRQQQQQQQQQLQVSSEIFSSMSANVIYRILFGTRATDEPHFAQHLRSVQTIVQADVYSTFGTAVLMPLLLPLCRPLMWHLRKIREAKEAIERVLQLMDAKLADARSSKSDNFQPNGFAEAALRAGAGDEDFSEGKLAVTLFDLLIAGTDTTSCTLKWASLRLSLHVDWQRRLAARIDSEVGSRCVTQADSARLPELLAFIEETQRLNPVLPTAINHRATATLRLSCGSVIPEGAWVFPNLVSAHTEQAHFPQPLEFRPERFLEGGRFKPSPRVLPFSTGPRACLGEQLARMEVFLALAWLLQRYSVSLAPQSISQLPQLLKGSTGLVCSPPQFQLLLSKRTDA